MSALNLAKARAFNSRLSADDAALVGGLIGHRCPPWTDEALRALATWQDAKGLAHDAMAGALTLAAMRDPTPRGLAIPQWAHEIAALPLAVVGVDVSFWQPEIDAGQIARDGAKFAILRGTEARSTDARLGAHYEALTAQRGIAIGVYHLPHQSGGTWDAATTTDPVRQAMHAAEVARRYPATGGMLQMLDLEPDRSDGSRPPRMFTSLVAREGAEAAARWVARWLEVFEGAVGAAAGVYYSPALAKAGGEALERAIGERVRWVASYLRDPRWVPLGGKPLPRWDIWQVRADDNEKTPTIDESGRCRGVMRGRKACDVNIVNPTSPLWTRLGGRK